MYKPTNIAPPERIAEHLTEIQAFIEAHYEADNPQQVTERAVNLEAYMALSGKLLADAEYHYNELTGSTIMAALKDAMSAKLQTSTLNKYVEAQARDYKYLVTWCDRVNRSCTHQLDMMRTIISKLKSEMYHAQRA